MKPEEIIDMAKQAGIEEAYSLKHNQYLVRFKDESLEVFAKLVAEAEREACILDVRMNIPRNKSPLEYQMAMRVIARIEARGQT